MTRQAKRELDKWFERGHWVGVFELEYQTHFSRKSVPFVKSEWDEYECFETMLIESPGYQMVAKCRSIDGVRKALNGELVGDEPQRGESIWSKAKALIV